MTRPARTSRHTRVPPRRCWRGLGCVLVVVALSLIGCAEVAPGPRTQADELTNQIRSMPGVLSASNDVIDTVAMGNVHFWLSVEVAEDVTADQVAAITS